MSKVIGIIGNTLYIEPFYAGDHIHSATISDYTKSSLLDRDVKEYDTQKQLEDMYWSFLSE